VIPLRRRVLFAVLRAADLCVMLLALVASWIWTVPRPRSSDPFEFLSVSVQLVDLLFLLCLLVTWRVVFATRGLYRSQRVSSAMSEWWEVAKAVTVGTLGLAMLALLFDARTANRSFIGSFYLIALPGTVMLRSVLRSSLGGVRKQGRNLRHAIIVGCNARAAAYGKAMRDRPELGYLLRGYVDDLPAPRNSLNGEPETLLGSLQEVEAILGSMEIDEVFVVLPIKSFYDTIARIIAASEDLGVIVRMPVGAFELRVATADIDNFFGEPLLSFSTPRPGQLSRAFKRLLDVIVAATALAALAPFLLVCGLAVKLDSSGPALFLQDRIGLGGRKFRMAKFRTMAAGSDRPSAELEKMNEVQGAAFKIENDPRLTGIGAFLRKFSIDELPQLWNVLCGNMSLVGPRPLPVRDVQKFQKRWQKRRFSVKPGLTCIWQANGRHAIKFDNWMELDLQYIDNWSLRLDFEIMLKTIPAILWRSGSA